MPMLSNITSGIVKRPELILLYGADGVGKTTFAAQAPEPIFLGSEGGSDMLDVARFPKIRSFKEASNAVVELTNEKHKYKTLVIDSVDWLETILHRDICADNGVKSIEKVDGGYGKGYVLAFNWWNAFREQIDKLRETGMNIILIGHADIATFNDPNTQSTYERYQVKLNKRSSALLREWVDCVFFANFEVFTKKEDRHTRAFGDGARVMYTERRPGFDAKNRKCLPFTIPLGWEDYMLAAEKAVPNCENIVNQITEVVKEINDPELAKVVLKTTKESEKNFIKLEAILNRLRIRLENV